VVDLEPTEHLAFFTYEDRPGMVGTVGKILGDAHVNIAGMQVSRDTKGGQALVALSVDSAVPAEVLEEIRGSIDADMVRGVDLSD
jgi:D-3-phosphoglycerate dehydrogenase